MTPEHDPRSQRQKSRAIIMAVLLGAFVILIYFISIAKMSVH